MAECVICSSTEVFKDGKLCPDCSFDRTYDEIGEIDKSDFEKIVIKKNKANQHIKIETQFLTMKKTEKSTKYINTGKNITLSSRFIDKLISLLERAKVDISHTDEESSLKHIPKSQTYEVIKKLQANKRQSKVLIDKQNFDKILKLIINDVGCSEKDIKSKEHCDKSQHLSEARQLLIYIVRKTTKLTIYQIAKLLKDETLDIIHIQNKVQDRIDSEDGYDDLVHKYINQNYFEGKTND